MQNKTNKERESKEQESETEEKPVNNDSKIGREVNTKKNKQQKKTKDYKKGRLILRNLSFKVSLMLWNFVSWFQT